MPPAPKGGGITNNLFNKDISLFISITLSPLVAPHGMAKVFVAVIGLADFCNIRDLQYAD